MKEKMMAAVFEKVGVLTVKEVDVPKITKPDDLIIDIELCSICGTDVHIMADPPGYIATPNTILGHELVGKIVEVGSGVKTLKVGDRVVVNPNDYCGVCEYCMKNLPNQCQNIIPLGIEANGGFAEFVRVSEKVAHKISDSLPAEIAAFAEPLACVVNGAQKVRIQPGESALVIGAGPIGLLFVQMFKACGAFPIIVSEPTALRQEYAKKCGADYVVNPMEKDLETFVKEITGIGVDVAVDVVGSQVWEGVKAIRKGGKVLVFGVNTRAEPKIIQSQVTFKEAQILGTWLANATFPTAVKILESGVLNLKDLITHTFPLSRVNEGISLLTKGEGIEILIDPRIK